MPTRTTTTTEREPTKKVWLTNTDKKQRRGIFDANGKSVVFAPGESREIELTEGRIEKWNEARSLRLGRPQREQMTQEPAKAGEGGGEQQRGQQGTQQRQLPGRQQQGASDGKK